VAREELTGAKRDGAPVFAAEDTRTVGEGAKHEAVPRGKHLLIAPRPYAYRSAVIQLRARSTNRILQLGELGALPCGDRGRLVGHVKDVVPLEVSSCAHSPVSGDEAAVIARGLLELRRAPHVELALLTFTIRIEGGVEPTLRRQHFANRPLERFLRHASRLVVTRRLPEMNAEAREQRVVVQHLLEVRHQPHRIDRITMEAAADLVVDPAAGHAAEGVCDDLEGV
jgi:hypothetical protein